MTIITKGMGAIKKITHLVDMKGRKRKIPAGTLKSSGGTLEGFTTKTKMPKYKGGQGKLFSEKFKKNEKKSFKQLKFNLGDDKRFSSPIKKLKKLTEKAKVK